MMDIKRFDVLHYALKCAVPVACMVCAGCDIELPSLRTATEKVAEYSEQQMPKEPVASLISPVNSMRSELVHFASSRLKIISADIVQAEKDLSVVNNDRKAMSSRVSELSREVFSDKNAKREDALLALLKDKELNMLAAKYLGADFSLMCNGFVSKVRHAYEQRQRKEDALSENRQMYEKTIGGLDARESKTAENRSAEIQQLERKISEAERRLRYLRTSIMTSVQARRDRDREVSVTERELGGWNRHIALLRSQSVNRSPSSLRSQALMRLDNANRDVERRFKDSITAFKVAEECEEGSVKRLENAVALKENDIRDRLYLLKRQKLVVSSLVSDVEKLDSDALASVREEINRILSWSVEDAKKGLGNVRK